MNLTNNLGDYEMGAEGPPGSVSRSGRVRKKNSLLAVYDSSDVVDKRKRRTGKMVKNNKVVNNIGIGGRPHAIGKNHLGHYQDYGISSDIASDSYDSLDILNQTYDGEVPDFAGEEEVIDHLSDGDGETNKFYTNNSRLKSQAESTYMMEKTYVKQKKMLGPKKKATRKDKGSPRVTAYMLWAKEQRTNFTQKYPHMDFSSLSKKLSDLWATVPQNQKRMWKTKAAKIMKKNANGAEQRNIKNSAGPTLVLARKNLSMLQQRKGMMMKNTTPEVPVPKKIGRPPKLSVAGIVVQKKISLPKNPNVPQLHNHKAKKSKASRFTKTKRKKKFVPGNALANHKLPQPPMPSSSHTEVIQSFSPASYQFNVNCGTDTLDVAAHLSLLGESMKNLGTSIQQNQHNTSDDSLSSLLDSLLCAVGPLLCLTRQVPELDCIPEDQLKRILGNSDYIMPGLQ